MGSKDWFLREHACDIQDSIIADEAANMVLRMSPTRTGAEGHPKIVIMPIDDSWSSFQNSAAYWFSPIELTNAKITILGLKRPAKLDSR